MYFTVKLELPNSAVNCMTYFECPSVSEAAKKRKRKFLEKFLALRNLLCELFTDKTTSELSL